MQTLSLSVNNEGGGRPGWVVQHENQFQKMEWSNLKDEDTRWRLTCLINTLNIQGNHSMETLRQKFYDVRQPLYQWYPLHSFKRQAKRYHVCMGRGLVLHWSYTNDPYLKLLCHTTTCLKRKDVHNKNFVLWAVCSKDKVVCVSNDAIA